MGARVLKELTLRDSHPFLYQRHIFEGGTGAVPVANHAMVRLPTGARISYSPKRWAETPTAPLEGDPSRGRSILAYPARSTDLTSVPRADGGTVDLTAYPIDQGHEDFAMLLEADGSPLGWSAVVRSGEGDMALMLKNPARLPITMLWYLERRAQLRAVERPPPRRARRRRRLQPGRFTVTPPPSPKMR